MTGHYTMYIIGTSLKMNLSKRNSVFGNFGCLNWCFTVPLGPCLARSVELRTLFLGKLSSAVNQYCAHTFTCNWQLPFLNQRKGENDYRNDFIINLHESYVAELRFKLLSLKSAVRRTSDCAIYSAVACAPACRSKVSKFETGKK